MPRQTDSGDTSPRGPRCQATKARPPTPRSRRTATAIRRPGPGPVALVEPTPRPGGPADASSRRGGSTACELALAPGVAEATGSPNASGAFTERPPPVGSNNCQP